MFVITGANGLLGCYLVSSLVLKGNSNLTCIIRSEEKKEQLLENVAVISGLAQSDFISKIEFRIGDILDIIFLEEEFNEQSIVIHAAASVSFNPTDRDLLFETNIQGTQNVVNACLAKKVKKLCYISSVAAIGRTESLVEITEETQWHDTKHNSTYAISKHHAELEVWRGGEEGLPIVMVNPTVVLGYTGNGNSSSSIFHNIKKGFPFASKGINGFVGAADVAEIVLKLIEHNIENERFVVCAENIAFDKLFATIAISLGKRPPTIIVKKWMKWVTLPLAWFHSKLTGKPPFVTKEVFNTSISNNYYSANKLKQTIGFQFTPIAKVVEEVAANMS